jgi:ABC-type dipeptide/oligopeptide/nickel transport system permease component
VPIGAALAVAFVLAVPIACLHGRRRARAAGVAGAVAAAVTIASLPVFWHGVVISALPAAAARIACGLALVAGAAAASLSLLREFDG